MWPIGTGYLDACIFCHGVRRTVADACETEQCFALPQPDHREHRDRARHPSGLAKILRLSEQEALTPFFETTAAGEVDKRLRGARSM